MYLLRWFWWRINAWTEVVAMISSFAISVLFFTLKKSGNPWPFADTVLYSVAFTTICWLVAAYVTPPTARERLIEFYRTVHPSGPGWRKVREEAGISETDAARYGNRIGQAALGWVAGCLTIWSSLFAIGNILYGRYQLAVALIAIFVVSGAVLIVVINNLWDRPAATGPRRVADNLRMSKRVLVVGLGNMGMSHALAYIRIPGFEVAASVHPRDIARGSCPRRSPARRSYSHFDIALVESSPTSASQINTLPDTHAEYAVKAMEAARPCSSRSRSPRAVRDTRDASSDAGRTGNGSWCRLHLASIRRGCASSRSRAARDAARLPHEPEPAVERRAWAWHKRLMRCVPADCRLRRPLRRRHGAR